MSRKFRSKRSVEVFKLNKILIFLILVLVTFLLSFNYLYKYLTKNISEIEIIDILLNKTSDKLYPKTGISFLINYAFGINLGLQKKQELPVIEEVEEKIDVGESEPLIYIYNTHQTEEYKKINNASYSITPTVFHASLIFQTKLKQYEINSVVEKNNIKEILDINSWNYRNSYKASKMLAENALSENSSIKYIIDLHRDSIPENVGNVLINNKKYARMMIVLGTGHDGYNDNLEFATRINNYLKEFDEGITRGIDIKKNSGIYNQDLSSNALLIEVGGQYNDIESVANSLEVLASIYKKVIDEDNEKKEI